MDEEKVGRKADKLFEAGIFEEALPLYLSLEQSTPLRCYKIGVCYYNSIREKAEGIAYFECYLEASDSLNTAHFYLARLYHLNLDFDQAIVQYEKFKASISNDPRLRDAQLRDELVRTTERYIENCNYGKMMLAYPREAKVENLGEEVNSEYRDYAPVIDSKESEIYYTTRRPMAEEEKMARDGRYYEKILRTDIEKGSLYATSAEEDSVAALTGYYSLLTDLQLSFPELLDEKINTKGHNAPIQLGNNDARLFFYRDFNVWTVDWKDSVWGEPEKFPLSGVNSKSFEPSIFVAHDEQSVFVVSDREGGYGGLDIYRMDRKSDGTWTPLYNLGPKINTAYDEDAPYFDPDGQTLYFSSEGHTSMGGFDVFRVQQDGTGNRWTDAINMGHPVNTPGDDIYYVMTNKYNRAYYASDNLSGYGELDLYRLTFTDERDPVAELKGVIMEGEELVPLPSEILLLDHTEEEVAVFHNDSTTGEYLLLLGHGSSYDMLIETEGFVPFIRRVDVPEQKKYYRLYQEIHQIHLQNQEGEIIGQAVMMFNNFGVDGTVPVDSLSVLYDSTSAEYMDYIRDLQEIQEGNVYTDVKYYMSRDSLMGLVEADTTITTDYPQNTEVSYFEPRFKSSTLDDPNAYISYLEEELDPNAPEVLLNNMKDVGELAGSVDPFEHRGKLPDIVLYFEYDESAITPASKEDLQKLVEFMKLNPAVRFKVVGHTDDKGEETYNAQLSLERAQEVVDYLVSQGVSRNALEAVGLGEDYPIQANDFSGVDNPEGRKFNRRVEFILVH